VKARWWLTDGVFLTLWLTILAGATLLTPGGEAVYVWGYEVPPLCAFRVLTGHGCPGCGLTRSFVFMGHGQVLDAFAIHKLGPLFFAALIVQVPLTLRRLWLAYQAQGPGARA
jgi:hypothetical protein